MPLVAERSNPKNKECVYKKKHSDAKYTFYAETIEEALALLGKHMDLSEEVTSDSFEQAGGLTFSFNGKEHFRVTVP